jgi:large subunit ribosomal protein L25
MADHIPLTAEPRTPNGSREGRRLRRSGTIPGVVYSGGGEATSFAVDELDLRRVMLREGGRTGVIDLTIGSETQPVLFKDWQIDPMRGQVVHVDLQGINMTVEVESMVPLVLVGDSIGVKEGGVLDQTERELMIRALPTNLVDTIEFDVSELAVGDSVALSEIVAPSGVAILGDPENTVASITLPRAAVEEEPTDLEGEEGEVGDEGADGDEGGDGGDDDSSGDDAGE